MDFIPEDRRDRLIDGRGKPRKRIGDYSMLYRHGWARIIIGLPGMGLGALVILGWTRGEPGDSWPLLACGWIFGLIFILDGLATLRFIPDSDVSAPAAYPDMESVRSMLQRAGPYRGEMSALSLGPRIPNGSVYHMTAPTGQVNQWGEPIEVTAAFDREANFMGIEYHIHDLPVVDRGGGFMDDSSGGEDLGNYLDGYQDGCEDRSLLPGGDQ